MRYLLRNSIFVVALLVLMAAMAFPPSQKLRLGKDLRGGVTLIYAVQVDRAANASEAIAKTIEVLKRRVDPRGLFEIQMIAQGKDRIEISMPLPGASVLELRADFEAKLAALQSQSMSGPEFDRVMRLDEGPRNAELERLAGGSQTQFDLLAQAAQSQDQARSLRILRDAAEATEQPQGQINDLSDQIAAAELRYENLRTEALASTLDPEQLRRTLDLSKVKKHITGENDEVIFLPSAYERGMLRIKERHPELADKVQAAVDAFDVYTANRKSLDDPADLKRMLAGSGVLEFRIAADASGSRGAVPHPEEARLREELQEKGPRNVRSRDGRWYPIDQVDNYYDSQPELDAMEANPSGYFAQQGYVVERYEGEYYMLLWDAKGLRLTQAEGRWGLAGSSQTVDELGRPAIGFRMDPRGAALLGDLTGSNTGNFMAIVLDNKVITAPNINSRISSNGIIQGSFPPEELGYVIRVLNAGSLQARLAPEPLSEIRIAPELGLDNLVKGLNAGLIALVGVSVFMIIYYFGYGVVAVVCLGCNALLILGAMAMAQASFTLPGIAGVILTFGMAVDANVLIFERIREELRNGLDLRVAVKLGYEKALSSIVDGNVTNLIVCFVLAYTGTQEIKGFAITLGIGVVATLFSALVISRVIFAVLVDKIKVRKMTMLPMRVPLIERMLEPKINWLKLRFVFITISLIYVSIGIAMVATRGERMLDTEFRGGTQVDMHLRVNPEDPDGGRMTLTRPEVEAAIRAVAADLGENDPLRALRTAGVMAMNAEPDGITSSSFQIKTYATDTDAVLTAIINTFIDKIDAFPALQFDGAQATTAADAPVFPIMSNSLGESVGRPDLLGDVGKYLGGVAIMMDNITTRTSKVQIEQRLDQMRSKSDFSSTLQRRHEVRVLRGSPEEVKAAVVLVADDGVGFFENEDAWRAGVEAKEWRLLSEALTKPTTAASVQSFSSVIAEQFKGQAVVAVLLSLLLILLYIWVRFGSVRYSMAAIVTLTHDVLTAIGLIALAEIAHDSEAIGHYASKLGIEPFKIDLNMIAALLTIIGYSLNDTIIIMDRIRENRGRLPSASARVINLSINQTISRTVITSGTTLVAVLILYTVGGSGVRAFSFTLLIGIVVGTYSSIAVAAPLVWSGKSGKVPTDDPEGETPILTEA
ncbi:MAG: SecD/SecF fusion protein [Phycisphaerales bacterium]|jgi:SecD/SecF fusion protein